MKYSILAQKSPDYLADEWAELDDLYCGRYKSLKSADKYLPKMIGETPGRDHERLKVPAHMSYLGQIVAFLAANLFSQKIKVAVAADAADLRISDSDVVVAILAPSGCRPRSRRSRGRGVPASILRERQRLELRRKARRRRGGGSMPRGRSTRGSGGWFDDFAVGSASARRRPEGLSFQDLPHLA